MSTNNTMSEGAVASMERDVEFFCYMHDIEDPVAIDDLRAIFRQGYEFGRIAAQGEAFAAQIDAHFAAMAAAR